MFQSSEKCRKDLDTQMGGVSTAPPNRCTPTLIDRVSAQKLFLFVLMYLFIYPSFVIHSFIHSFCSSLKEGDPHRLIFECLDPSLLNSFPEIREYVLFKSKWLQVFLCLYLILSLPLCLFLSFFSLSLVVVARYE